MKEKVAESTLSPRHLFPQSPLPPSFAHTRDMQQLLKPQELAEIINVSPQTIMKWYYDGIIPARIHVGRIVRFELDAVMIALTERLEARVPAPIKELIGRAASLEGVSLTDYVIATLQKNAAMVGFVNADDAVAIVIEARVGFHALIGKPFGWNRGIIRPFVVIDPGTSGVFPDCLPSSMPPLSHHEFVAFGIDAHGEVQRIFRGVVWFGGEASAAFGEAGNSLAQVIELEGQSSPRPLALATAMNPECGACNDDFTPDLGLETHHAPEEFAIEFQATLPIGRPQHILYFLNLHGRRVRRWRWVCNLSACRRQILHKESGA